MKSPKTLASVAILALAASCSGLSREAKEIVGDYYNTELSQTEPVMELHKDGTCVIRAIRPGVLTYSVDGRWNVEHDSLVMTLDPSTLSSRGDASLVGHIPSRYAVRIIEHNDFNMTLEQGGATYLYTRHNTK